MKVKHRLRWVLLAGLATVALSSALVIPPLLNRQERLRAEVSALMSKYTPINLAEAIENQGLHEVNVSIEIYDQPYEFNTAQGSFAIVLSRHYNFSNETLFDGNHALWFDYSKLGKRFRRTARKIEQIIEQDPLIGESAESLQSFLIKNGPTLRHYIKQICSSAETKTFDRLLGDLDRLVEEDKFSFDEPFESVLINNYHPSCVQDTPTKLDEEIKARLLSPDDENSYVSPDEIERLNEIFKNIAEKEEFDIRRSTFDETILFFLKTIHKHFAIREGGPKEWYDEEKNKLPPSAILSNPDEIDVTCAPPALYLTRMINYANAVNPNFRHMHALATATVDFEKERKEWDYCRHAIVGVVDTENRKISFLDPLLLVAFPFYKPKIYNGIRVTTSYRNDILGYFPGEVITTDGTSGINLRQFFEESRRNLKRRY